MAGVKVHNPITGTMRAIGIVAILGVLGYDGVQIGINHINAKDASNDAAHAGEDTLFDHGTLAMICASAQLYAKQHGLVLDLNPAITVPSDPTGSVRLGNCRVNADSSIDIVVSAKASRIVLGRFDQSLIAWTVKGHADKEN